MFKNKFKETTINTLANKLASLQRKADVWYYERHNQDMSSFCLSQVTPIVDVASELGISTEVYQRAYKIYDFFNSGREGYTLKNGKIVKEEE